MVDDTFENKKFLYNKYKSKKKLKLKGIKYFQKPIIAKDLAEELKFVVNNKKSAYYFKSEYREIEEIDFSKIISFTNSTKTLPTKFNNIVFNQEEFLLNLMKSLYKVLKEIKPKSQLEIKVFLKYVMKALHEFGIEKDLNELKEFYSHNAWKLNFKHNRSRDPDRSVILYNRLGKKRIFSYISLE